MVDHTTVSLRRYPKVEGYYKEVDEFFGIKPKQPLKIFGWNDYIHHKPSNINLIVNWINLLLN